jgi:hypothetical protein
MLLTTTALGASPGLAQNVEQVKPVFEHVLPNVKGKRMVAVVVTYPPRRQIAGSSSCPVGIHLCLRAVRHYFQPG